MARSPVIRFAAGTPDAPYSGVWRLVATGDDVYLGAGRHWMSKFKLSLHQSGVWTFAATKESGILLRDGNRRARQWRRPPAHVAGTFRGPTIVAPHTSYGSHLLLPAELQKNVRWFPAPSPGHGVEFTLYFHDAREGASWGSEQFVLAETVLRGGLRVVVLACERPMPGSFSATVEELLRTSVIRYEDESDHLGGSLLWISESADALRTPFIVDMPAPVAEN